jgi:hypothetical protein
MEVSRWKQQGMGGMETIVLGDNKGAGNRAEMEENNNENGAGMEEEQ